MPEEALESQKPAQQGLTVGEETEITRHQAARGKAQKAIALALGVTATFFVAELLTGIFTHSLALLADAGHMLTDSVALLMALGAAWYSTKPATARRSWGYYRLEVLAAFLNGLLLVAVVGFIYLEAVRRLQAPPEIKSVPMLVVAVLGLGANLLSAAFLVRGRKVTLNVEGAFANVLGDLLSSGGAIGAGVVMLTTGWFLVDPIVSMTIGLVILYPAWRLIRIAVGILMESTPKGIDLDRLYHAIRSTEDVKDAHDLHVWTLTTGFIAMSGHVVLGVSPDGVRGQQRFLSQIRTRLKKEFNIDHATIQLETAGLPDEEVHCKGEPVCLA
ncbi:MAG: cation transporter [Chloroflexi bacterium]|nr:cation transporter [Chloroflexota bacterium]